MRSRIPGDSLRDSETGENRELGEILSFGDAPERCFASADSLNNAAVSLMEAGREAEAERIWRAALLKEPGHADSFFNREIFLRRKGRRTTKEVYVSLEKAGIAERADVAADLAQECGAVPEPVQAHGYQFNLGTHFLDAQVDGGEIRFLYTENNAIRILVFDRLNGTQIKRNFMSRLLKTDEPVRAGAFLPDGQRYVLVTDRISVNHLYDPQVPAVCSGNDLPPIHRKTVDEYTRIHFSRDGKMMAVSEPKYSDRKYARTILFHTDTMQLAADLHMKFVCMPRSGGCLVRGDVETAQGTGVDALFHVRQDGVPREVFRFEKRPSGCIEIDQDPAPFLAYCHERTREYYMIDEDWKRVPLPQQIYKEAGTTVFCDPDRALLYTLASMSSLHLWDLHTMEMVFTFEIETRLWNDPNGRDSWSCVYLPGVQREAGGWSLTTAFFDRQNWKNNYIICWYNFSLADWKKPSRIAYHRSPETDPAERAQRKARADRLRDRFSACVQAGDTAGACAAYCEYRDIPGAYGTTELKEMETAVDISAVKQSVYRVHPLENLHRPPLFVMGGTISYSECPGGIIALCEQLSSKIAGAGISLFRRDGTLIRQIFLPRKVVYGAVRGDRIYGFCKDDDCILKDLEGNDLPLPWEDWPQEETFYDMSPDGRLLLYTEIIYPSVKGFRELRLKDLETGMETMFSQQYVNKSSRVLDGGRVFLFEKSRYTGRLIYRDPAAGTEKKLDACEFFDMDPEKGIVVAAVFRDRGYRWQVFDTDLSLLREWQETCESLKRMLIIPGTGLFVYVAKTKEGRVNEYAVRIRDSASGELLFDVTMDKDAALYIRPDGREIYAVRDEAVSEAWAIEYNYRL